MNKIFAWTYLILSLLSAQAVFGVWPPSTALEKVVVRAADQEASQRLVQVIEKLEKDENRLACVVSALEDHEKKLKSKSPDERKENNHGHRLR